MRDVPDWMDAAFYSEQRSERVPLVVELDSGRDVVCSIDDLVRRDHE